MKTLIAYWLVVQVPQALAALGPNPPGDSGIEIENPLACGTAVKCVQSILNGLVFLAAPVVAIMVLVGGFQIMASGGNEEKLRSGKNTIIYAVVGYAVILLSSGVVAVIQDALSAPATP